MFITELFDRLPAPINKTAVDPETVKRAGPQMKRELGTISRDLRFVASAK